MRNSTVDSLSALASFTAFNEKGLIVTGKYAFISLVVDWILWSVIGNHPSPDRPHQYEGIGMLLTARFFLLPYPIVWYAISGLSHPWNNTSGQAPWTSLFRGIVAGLVFLVGLVPMLLFCLASVWFLIGSFLELTRVFRYPFE